MSETQFAFFFLVMLGSILAGFVGALAGLGGGLFVVPLLTLVFGLPIHEAIGASIVSVIATSSGAAAAYVRDHITNLRVGMFLEIATTLGALTGAFVAIYTSQTMLFIIFAIILLISAAPLLLHMGEDLPSPVTNDRWANALSLADSYSDQQSGREIAYQVTNTPVGFGMMYLAGMVSGLLGIGSGVFKVMAMDLAMHLPIKVSSTTSNFMIGVTAAASAGVYFLRGQIHPLVAAPVALGVLIGAMSGARVLPYISNQRLRQIFVIVVLLVAIQMLLRGFGIGTW
jgi:uncharacterized membrane protein YfcA